MSLAEMKVAIIEKIAATTDEALVVEIMHKLQSQNGQSENSGAWDVDEFYNRAQAEYGDVLQRLAQ